MNVDNEALLSRDFFCGQRARLASVTAVTVVNLGGTYNRITDKIGRSLILWDTRGIIKKIRIIKMNL